VLRASPHSSQRSGCQEQARRTLAGAQALEHGLVAQCVLAGLHDQLQAGIYALTSLGLLRLWTPKQARVRAAGGLARGRREKNRAAAAVFLHSHLRGGNHGLIYAGSLA